MPLVLQHGDFSGGDIMYDKNKKSMCVLDWQYAFFHGVPLVDLLRFFMYTRYMITGYEAAKSKRMDFRSFTKNIHNPLTTEGDFIDIFYSDNWMARLAAKCIYKYCEELKVDKRLLVYIFLLYVLRHLYVKDTFLAIALERGRPVLWV